MHLPFLTAMLIATLILLTVALLTTQRLIRQHHAQKMDFFAHSPLQPEDVVFLGDSLTDGARWNELFPELSVKNRGINADTTAGVLNRLDGILAAQPAAVFLLVGTNDLPWFLFRSNTAIVETYKRILQRFQAEAPQTRVFVQSLLPRDRRYARRILRLNARLEALARRYGCTWIDLYPHFADRHGALRSELTNDHLHLLADGYALWVELLQPHLQSISPAA